MSGEADDLPPPGATDDDLGHLLSLVRRRRATAREIADLRDVIRTERETRTLLADRDADLRALREENAAGLAEWVALRDLLHRERWNREEEEAVAAYRAARRRALRARAILRDAMRTRPRRRPPNDALLLEMLASSEARIAISLLWLSLSLVPALVDSSLRVREAADQSLRLFGPSLPMSLPRLSALIVRVAEALAGPGYVRAPGWRDPADELPAEVVAYLAACHPVQAREVARDWRALADGSDPPARRALRRLRADGAAVLVSHPNLSRVVSGRCQGLLPLSPVDEAGTGAGEGPAPPGPR